MGNWGEAFVKAAGGLAYMAVLIAVPGLMAVGVVLLAGWLGGR